MDNSLNKEINEMKNKGRMDGVNLRPYSKEELHDIFYKNNNREDDLSQVISLKKVKYPVIDVIKNTTSTKYAIMTECRNPGSPLILFKVVNLTTGEIEDSAKTLELANVAINKRINEMILNLKQGDVFCIKKINE